MKLFCAIALVLSTLFSPAHADVLPLRIAVVQYTSPFVMQGNNQLYGFDIAMMTYICPIIQRVCQYQVMEFSELLPAVAANKVDVAISGITITPSRAKIVNFSVPYLVSETRFLGRSALAAFPFSLGMLQKSKFGVQTGTVFNEEILSLGLENPSITSFQEESDLIEAVTDGTVDIVLVDQATAMYWQGHSAGQLVALGQPIPYGYGFGIAVSSNEPDLLKSINQAIVQYQNSNDFKTNILMYMNYF